MERRALPIILLASVIQGWALYGLYLAIEQHHWPATRMQWLLGLYAVATFIPTSIQLIAAQLRSRAAVASLLILSALYFYFGWFEGADILPHSSGQQLDRGYDSLYP